MRRYLLTLTGSADGVEDLNIPMHSFSYRQKNGAQSRLSVVVPYAYADGIDARPNGELVINWLDDGNVVEELARANLSGVAVYGGPQSRSITVEGTKQSTWTAPEDPVILRNVIYRDVNQTDGRWNYRMNMPIAGLKAGYDVTYGDHTFTAGEIQHQVTADRHTVYLSEASAVGGDDGSSGVCYEAITPPVAINGDFESACLYAETSEYHAAYGFTLTQERQVSCLQTSGAGLALYLVDGPGLTNFNGDGTIVSGAQMVYGSGFIATLPPGEYTVQIRSTVQTDTYTLEFTFPG